MSLKDPAARFGIIIVMFIGLAAYYFIRFGFKLTSMTSFQRGYLSVIIGLFFASLYGGYYLLRYYSS